MLADRLPILVVDDLSDAAESTAEVVSLWGYEATACQSGALALAWARARMPAVVLLDLVMPRMDGFQLARAFHELPGCAAVPLVAISGYWSPAYMERAAEAGIGHYLLKPADLNELERLLHLLTHPLSSARIRTRRQRGRGHLVRRRPALTSAASGEPGPRSFQPRILAD